MASEEFEKQQQKLNDLAKELISTVRLNDLPQIKLLLEGKGYGFAVEDIVNHVVEDQETTAVTLAPRHRGEYAIEEIEDSVAHDVHYRGPAKTNALIEALKPSSEDSSPGNMHSVYIPPTF